MPDRPKVRDQTKRDIGVYAVRGGGGSLSGRVLRLIRHDRASAPTNGVTPEKTASL